MAIQHVLLVDSTDTEYTGVKPFPVTSVQTPSALGTGTETNPVSSTAVQVLALNTSRKVAIIQNTGAANVRVGGSNAVTATNGIQVAPGAMLTFATPYVYSGAVWAIREGATDSKVLAMEAT